ncbi:MAG TPA: DNA-3-methyladenine glycosylase [Patescibacteria group bacterium]|nr:DNA-3-methyladenine glycosylase [Patescibacteria group bacterium]
MKAAEHLARHDPVLKPLVKKFGIFKPTLHTNYYYRLVRSIIGQQLSVKAASSIEKRFLDLFGGELPSPEQILQIQPEELRAVGLSNAKVAYVRDLAQHILNGQLELEKLPKLSNEEIIKELVAVKGIGEWSAHMFLIFALGRQDVLPTGDLGVRSGIKKLYGYESLPTPTEIIELAEKNNWHPYESVAAWYIWQSLDNSP